MLIDWFTVGAQVLNFLILVWLMKRFLYQPILHAIDTREKRIAGALADAGAKRDEASKARDDYQARMAAFELQQAALLSAATAAATAERQRLFAEAHSEADALRTKLAEALDREQHDLYTQIAQRTRTEVFSIARKALADLADTALEESLCSVLIRHLQALGAPDKQALTAALAASPDLRISSAFTLLPAQQLALQNALGAGLGTEFPIRFECAPGLIGGIEINAGGQKLAWSIDSYLGTLEKSIADLRVQTLVPSSGTSATATPAVTKP
jgi:F-type H+-transporting ATPase subunit b